MRHVAMMTLAALIGTGSGSQPHLEVVHPDAAPHALLLVEPAEASIRSIEIRTPRGTIPDVRRLLYLDTWWVGWDWNVEGRRLMMWSRTGTPAPTCARGWVAVEGHPGAYFADMVRWHLIESVGPPRRTAPVLVRGFGQDGFPTLEVEASPARTRVGPLPTQIIIESNVPDTSYWVLLVDDEIARGGTVDSRDVGEMPEVIVQFPSGTRTSWAGTGSFRVALSDPAVPLTRRVRAVVVIDTDGDHMWSRNDLHNWTLLDP